MAPVVFPGKSRQQEVADKENRRALEMGHGVSVVL